MFDDLEDKLLRKAGEAGLSYLDVLYEDEETVEEILAGKRPFSSNRYASLVKTSQSFRTFAEEFELISRDFLESHIQILDHQIDAARMVFTNMGLRAILADEVGLGKTIEAGIIAKELEVRGMLQNLLVLCPKTLMNQWQDEFSEKFEMELANVKDDPIDKQANEAYWIANSRSWFSANSPIRDTLLKRKWDLIIVDEAHHFRRRSTKGYQSLVPAGIEGIESRYMLLLTATPIQNDLSELFSLMHIVRPGVLGSYPQFKRRYFVDYKGQQAKHAKELKRIVGNNMIRRRRLECGIDYTARYPTEHFLEFPGPYATAYKGIFELEANPLQKVNWLRLATSSMSALVDSLDRTPSLRASEQFEHAWTALKSSADRPEPKTAKLLELAEKNNHVVVFTEFMSSLMTAKRHLENEGILVHQMHGQLSLNQRRDSVRRFKDHGGVFLSLPSGSEGLNLQFCNVLANYDLPWNPMKVEQRIGRIHRIGQDRPVHVHTLVYRHTIEDYVLECLYRKLNLFRMCVGEIDNLFTSGTDDEDFQLDKRIQSIIIKGGTLDHLRLEIEKISGEIQKKGRTEVSTHTRLAEEVIG